MTWRRFCVLLGGLSTRSRFAGVVADSARLPRKPMALTDDGEIASFLLGMGG